MNSGTTLATTAATTWGQRNWEELLSYIEQKSVIPILGPDLVLVKREGRKAAAFFHAHVTWTVEDAKVPFPCAAIRDIRGLRLREAATDRNVQVVERLVASQIDQCHLPTLPTQ